jgi:hypothetical protein
MEKYIFNQDNLHKLHENWFDCSLKWMDDWVEYTHPLTSK